VGFALAVAAVAVFYGFLGWYAFRGDDGVRAAINVLMGTNAVLLVFVLVWISDWRPRSVILALLAPVLLVLGLVNLAPRRAGSD